MEALVKIQQGLKAPKGQTNSFGGYKYRSCEDILEAVKPLLGGATLTISDEMVMLGDRYYVKATATLALGAEEKAVTAYAREAIAKKGMDEAQVTGAASSYARKYALNGLFLIDDTKDADTMDNSTPNITSYTKAQDTMVDIIEAFNNAKDLMSLEAAKADRMYLVKKLTKDAQETLKNKYEEVKAKLTKEIK